VVPISKETTNIMGRKRERPRARKSGGCVAGLQRCLVMIKRDALAMREAQPPILSRRE
jgi:hypothetical protein